MGFYKNIKDPQSQSQRPVKSVGRAVGTTTRLVATIVLSALVGSGATLAVANATGLLGGQTSAIDSAVPPVNISGTPQSVNLAVSSWITTMVKQVEPSVAAIVNYTAQQSSVGGPVQVQASDVGTGVMFEKNGKYGYYVTNNHVVQGSDKVELVLSTGKHVPGKVVGTDQFTDLAVISVQDQYINGIQPLAFANSSKISVGEPVVAIGTPEGLDFADSVTSGIVSGDQRVMPVENPDSDQIFDYQPVIQTDAPINPGNSGGPLLNAAGQVIGINSSKIVASAVENMGFAIPSNEVVQIATEILKTGHAVHPALGIGAESVQSIMPYVSAPVDYGVYVASVDANSAKTGGLKTGQIIVAINGHTVQTSADLRTLLFQMKPGDVVALRVYEGSQEKTLHVRLTVMQSPNDTGSGQNAATGGSSGGSADGSPFGSSSNPFGSSGSPFGSSGNPFGPSGSPFGSSGSSSQGTSF